MTIDPEKLESRIKEARKLLCSFEAYDMSWKPMLAALVEASECTLATLPRYKEVEVWRVAFAEQYSAGWEPGQSLQRSEKHAKELAATLEASGCKCIEITGPHKQRVPA